MQRRLKKYAAKVIAGKMNRGNVYQSLQSWYAYSQYFNAYHTRRRMAALYSKLFVYDRRDELWQIQEK